jgi:hypothetical protein
MVLVIYGIKHDKTCKCKFLVGQIFISQFWITCLYNFKTFFQCWKLAPAFFVLHIFDCHVMLALV